jgi:hypothetical protein
MKVKKMNRTKACAISLPIELDKQIKQAANASGRSYSNFIAFIMNGLFSRVPPQENVIFKDKKPPRTHYGRQTTMVSITIPHEVDRYLNNRATQENRSYSNMASILLAKVISAEGSKEFKIPTKEENDNVIKEIKEILGDKL